jgi:hypothetical protein
VAWIDPTLVAERGLTPRQSMEGWYGELDCFELIEDMPPLHVGEILDGTFRKIRLPYRQPGSRKDAVAPILM